MCGRAYSPRFLFTWPNSRISVMGGEQAASVLASVHRNSERWTAEEAEAFKAPIRKTYEDEGSPWHATARLWDDGVIDPVQTRDVLGLAFTATLHRSEEHTSELQSLMRISYAVFCFKKNTDYTTRRHIHTIN